jgi:hypothetical protein
MNKIPSACRAAFVLACAGSIALGQGKQEDFTYVRVELMTHDEQIAFLKLAVDRGMPADMTDRVGLIVLNRAEEALPILIERIQRLMAVSTPSDRALTLMAGMVAYPGNERAMQGILQLCSLDSTRFAFLAARALDFAAGRQNRFDLAYYAIDHHCTAVTKEVQEWVSANVEKLSGGRELAEALRHRYAKLPNGVELEADSVFAEVGERVRRRIIEQLRGSSQ